MKNTFNKKGFTLIEILVAIGIMAIITAIAIPVCSGILQKSKVQSDEINATSYSTAMQLAWNTDNEVFSTTFALQRTSDYVEVSEGIDEVKEIITKFSKTTSFDPLTTGYHYFYSIMANKVVVADQNASITELNELAGNYDIAGGKLEANTIWLDLTNNTIK